MDMRLRRLTVRQFKGHKAFCLDAMGGRNITVTGANRLGKTTLYHAVQWLLFDKNADGKTKFSNRPLVKKGDVLTTTNIKGLIVSVEAEWSVSDRETVTFKREEHERFRGDEIVGYTSKYEVNGAPRSETEFKAAVKEIIDADIFRMLTDLRYVLETVHHEKRRDMLVNLAGEVGTPGGFEEWVAKLGKRPLKDHEKILSKEKKELVEERDHIPHRIDELQRGLAGYAADDSEAELTEKRGKVVSSIAELGTEKTALLAAEKEQGETRSKINALTTQRATREGELASDTSAVTALLDEKTAIMVQQSKQGAALSAIAVDLAAKRAELKAAQAEDDADNAEMVKFRAKYRAVKEAPPMAPEPLADLAPLTEGVGPCFNCGQALPQGKLDEIEANRQKRYNEDKAWQQEQYAAARAQHEATLNAMRIVGERLQADYDKLAARLEGLHGDVNLLIVAHEKADSEFAAAKAKNEARITEIDTGIAGCPRPKPEDDSTWNELSNNIAGLTLSLVTVDLTEITGRLTAAEAERTLLDQALKDADAARKAKVRIDELMARETELSEKISDVEGELARIISYEMAKSDLITSAVNDKFAHVRFKMFDVAQNGTITMCCEATLNGVPYAGLSTGEQILCGVDVINVLSEHYQMSVPLFIDHAESVTLDLGAKSQTIRLYADKKVKELKVEVA